MRDPTACCSDLFNTCLEVIDRNTTTVLASENLEDLDAAALEAIVRRGSLNLSSEVSPCALEPKCNNFHSLLLVFLCLYDEMTVKWLFG